MARPPRYGKSRTADVIVKVQPGEDKRLEEIAHVQKEQGDSEASMSTLVYRLIRIVLYPEEGDSFELARQLYARCRHERKTKTPV